MSILNVITELPEEITHSQIIECVAQNQIRIGDTIYIIDGTEITHVPSAYLAENGKFTDLVYGCTLGFAKSNANVGENVTVRTIGKFRGVREKVEIPTYSESLTYNGNAQSPNWIGYDSNCIDISGTISAIDAGHYITTFTPKKGYCWTDNSVAAKYVEWSIAQASGLITLSASSGTVAYPDNGSFTVTTNFDCALSVSTSNSSVAIASISGSTVTIVSKGMGTATITVTSEATTNYTAATASYTISVMQAFAVYSATANGSDGSLTFYSSVSKPEVGSTYDGKTVSAVYTGFDTASYAYGNIVPWYSVRESIKTVSFADSFKDVKPVSTAYWFYGASGMTSFDATNLDTSEVVNMGYMFYGCSGLTSIDVSGFDTGEVAKMSGMFAGCSGLTSLDVSGFDTSEVTNMFSMFYGCSVLKGLDLSSFDTSKVTNMSQMFYNCYKLTSLDVSNFDTRAITSKSNLSKFAAACTKLVEITLGENFGQSTNVPAAGSSTGMFYVSNATETTVIDANDVMAAYDWATDNRTVTFLDFGLNIVTPPTKTEYTEGESFDPAGMKVVFVDTDGTVTELTDGQYTYEPSGVLVEANTEVTISYQTGGNTHIAKTSIKVMSPITVTYNANGGHFDDFSTTNEVNYSRKLVNITKISKTANVSDDGLTADTDTGYGKLKADTDIVTIPGAKSLEVIITYQTEGINNDWVCVYDGSVTPNSFNYNSSISGKLGGQTKTTKTYTVPGDTVQFFLKSDISGYNYYGYYATISAETEAMIEDAGTNYKEPIGSPSYMELDGWYTDAECSAGKEFSLDSLESDITVYAKWKDGRQAFAIFDETDDSLTFYYDVVPQQGSAYDGRTVSAIYTGFDTVTYSSTSSVPWYNNRTSIKSVSFENEIAPVSTQFWFCEFSNSALTTMDLTKLNTSKVTNMRHMFNGCSGLTSLDVSGFKIDNVTNMQGMFSGCSGLTSLDVSKWNTSNVTDMSAMFNNCTELISLDVSNFDTSKVTNMGNMFKYCSKLTSLDVSGFDTSKVTSMGSMFHNCSKLTSLDVSGFDTSKVTDMYSMFTSCSKLTSIDVSGFDTSNVTDMRNMFKSCSGLTSLDLSNFDTSKITTTFYMFSDCSGLTSLDLSSFKTNNVTNMEYMFYNCSGLISLNLGNFDTSNVTNMNCMFAYCYGLTTIYVGNSWTTNAVTNSRGLFTMCNSLVGGNGTKVSDKQIYDATYAKIDKTGQEGYLTDIAAKPAA